MNSANANVKTYVSRIGNSLMAKQCMILGPRTFGPVYLKITREDFLRWSKEKVKVTKSKCLYQQKDFATRNTRVLNVLSLLVQKLWPRLRFFFKRRSKSRFLGHKVNMLGTSRIILPQGIHV